MLNGSISKKTIGIMYSIVVLVAALWCQYSTSYAVLDAFNYVFAILFSFVPFMIDYKERQRTIRWYYSIIVLDVVFFGIMLHFDDLHHVFVEMFGEGYGPYVTLIFLAMIASNFVVLLKMILGDEKGMIPFIVACICSYSIIVLQSHRIILCLVTQLGVMNAANALAMKITLVMMLVSCAVIMGTRKYVFKK